MTTKYLTTTQRSAAVQTQEAFRIIRNALANANDPGVTTQQIKEQVALGIGILRRIHTPKTAHNLAKGIARTAKVLRGFKSFAVVGGAL